MNKETDPWARHRTLASDRGVGAAVVDAERYTSPDIYKAECEKIFRRTWLLVARETEVRNPGDFIKRTIYPLETEALIVRGKDGVIRAFHNVCAHRGSALVGASEGTTNLFVCPYHAWSYGTDGKCKAITGAEYFPQVDKNKSRADAHPLRHLERLRLSQFRSGAQTDAAGVSRRIRRAIRRDSVWGIHPCRGAYARHGHQLEVRPRCLRRKLPRPVPSQENPAEVLERGQPDERLLRHPVLAAALFAHDPEQPGLGPGGRRPEVRLCPPRAPDAPCPRRRRLANRMTKLSSCKGHQSHRHAPFLAKNALRLSVHAADGVGRQLRLSSSAGLWGSTRPASSIAPISARRRPATSSSSAKRT